MHDEMIMDFGDVIRVKLNEILERLDRLEKKVPDKIDGYEEYNLYHE